MKRNNKLIITLLKTKITLKLNAVFDFVLRVSKRWPYFLMTNLLSSRDGGTDAIFNETLSNMEILMKQNTVIPNEK